MDSLDHTFPTVYQLHSPDKRIKSFSAKTLRCSHKCSSGIFQITLKQRKILKIFQHMDCSPTPYESNGVSYASFQQAVKKFYSLQDPSSKNRVRAFWLLQNFSQTIVN